MTISRFLVNHLQDYMVDFTEGYGPDDDWMMRHSNIFLDDISHTVTIEIGNMNEEDYKEWRSWYDRS